ncbi:hypothetical protein [Dietzia sp. PP-33]|uniref:hypothetical protein n=1 Tax=Dietzia sp. PP-33 TaxID=2957500 RepID=UPI00299FED2E|nr:hypothetical protein [Dietzia sp. PP-33]MDX2359061.1 hypothetical protein [Dietzia sp. PP-33]
MNTSGDVPLPGLEFAFQPRPDIVIPSRAYSSQIAPTAVTIERFWNRVIKAPGNGCWIFTGAVSGGDGYGRITWRSGGLSRTMSAHRFALLLAYGDNTTGTVGEHRCNEPLCVRVDDAHVIPSTQTANLRYAVACGRAGAHRATGDGRTRAERSIAVRAAVLSGWDPITYAHAAGHTGHAHTQRLF